MKITLKAARVNAGITCAEAAESVGYKRGSLWRWETGKAEIPAPILERLCRLYGVEEDDIQ